MDTFNYVQTQSTTLAGAGAVIGDTSVILSSFKQIDGTTNLTMTDFGLIGYMTLEPNSGTQEEQISFSGISQNANGTATLSGVKTVLFVAPYTETSGLAKTHAGGTKAIVSNTAGFYNKLTGKSDDEIITGKWTFPGDNVNRPTLSSDVDTTTATDPITYGQLSRTALASAIAATTTAVGYSKLSSASGTPTAPVVVETADPRVPTQGENNALVGNNTDIAVGTGNKFVTQTGFQHNAEKYCVDSSGGGTAYVGTLSPVPTSLTDGMVVYLKVGVTNSGTAPTFALNGLITGTIFKLGGTALAIGDMVVGDNTLIYDLTNTRWILQNPVANPTLTNSYFETTMNANGATGNGVFAKASFDTITFQGLSEFDTTNKRFVATNAGKYFFSAQVTTSQNGSNNVAIALYKNGTVFRIAQQNDNSAPCSASITAEISLAATDYIEVFTYASGVALTTLTSQTIGAVTGVISFFSGHRIA